MKVRKVTIEVEVPWEFTSKEVLECLVQGFDEIAYTALGVAVPHQEQLVSEVLSSNTRIGEVTKG